MKVRRQVEESKDVEAGVSGLKPWCGRTERYATGWKTQLLKDRRSQRERGRTGTGVEIIRTRLSGTKHVSMMSPVPDNPLSVSGFAPIFVASHRISAHPCATTAASALFPSSNPSIIPAAIASTFFSAPESSTPTTSLDVFTPQVRRREQPLDAPGEVLIRRRRDDRGGQALHELDRERGAGQHRERLVAAEPCGDHLRHHLARARLCGERR